MAQAAALIVEHSISGLPVVDDAGRCVGVLSTSDFTRRELPEGSWRRQHGVLRIALRVLKNLLGLLFAMLGVVMIFTPGQGLIALLLGLSLMDIPGKRTMQLAIIRRPGVLRAVNRLRARANRPSLELPPRKHERQQ